MKKSKMHLIFWIVLIIKHYNISNSIRNIERMIIYKDDEIVTPLVIQLPLTNNLLILSGTKTQEERLFYL